MSQTVKDAFLLMGYGMGSIFAVILLLTFIVTMLAKITNPAKKDKSTEA